MYNVEMLLIKPPGFNKIVIKYLLLKYIME